MTTEADEHPKDPRRDLDLTRARERPPDEVLPHDAADTSPVVDGHDDGAAGDAPSPSHLDASATRGAVLWEPDRPHTPPRD